MPREHSFGVREQAESLYLKGYTQKQVAELTGVPLVTIARWSSEAQWREKRVDRRRKLNEIDEKRLEARLALLRQAVDADDPMIFFALAKVEDLALKLGADDAPLPDDIDDIQTAADAARALEQALRLKARQIISQPETIDLAAINDLFKVWELLEKMKTEAGDDAEKPAANLEVIKEVLYGL